MSSVRCARESYDEQCRHARRWTESEEALRNAAIIAAARSEAQAIVAKSRAAAETVREDVKQKARTEAEALVAGARRQIWCPAFVIGAWYGITRHGAWHQRMCHTSPWRLSQAMY